MKMKSMLWMTAVCLVASVIAGCGDNQAPSAGGGAAAAWRLSTAPGDVVDIKSAKAQAREGDVITLRGTIGGRRDPITPESGLVVLMDPSVPSCAAESDDHCPTPWDYCCEPADVKTAHSATVQLRDSQGKPVRLAPDDLKPLQTIVVQGTVGARPNDQTLLVLAQGVFVEAQAPPAKGH
jgi:hypothetical protein